MTDNEGGIWQSGGGLMSDGPGRIFVATGNGVSPAPGPGGQPTAGNSATSAVRLGTLQQRRRWPAQDFFSPANAPALDAADSDFGPAARSGCRSAPACTRTSRPRRARTAGFSC